MLGLALACGCEGPVLLKDGSIAFPEKGQRGASVVTANGVEFRDRDDLPQRVVHHAVDDPWRAPVGFILPKSGRFTATSAPTVLGTSGLVFALRPSDTRVPSWGGEVLVRVDVIAPARPGEARMGERLAIVVDGSGPDTLILAETALERLGAWDRVAVIDSAPARVIVPPIPGHDRSLAEATLERQLRTHGSAPPDLARALATANAVLGATGPRRALVLSDGGIPPSAAALAELERLAQSGVLVSAVSTMDGADPGRLAALTTPGGIGAAPSTTEARASAVAHAVPAAGVVAFTDTILELRGSPAPSHVIETSGGGVRWRLDAGELVLGTVRAGEARTEVVRVTVPPFAPRTSFTFEVTAHAKDAATGEDRVFGAMVPCVYDDDIERIAQSRNGDVLAYASALATVKRLEGAFVGRDVERAGGVWNVARLHARSMSLLARDTHDRAIAEQAELLESLLAAVGP